MFDPEVWAAVPFHLWTGVLFVFGCVVGSFLNVCIYRMPRDMSLVSPPSHCPHCGRSIPWYLNIPLVTWLALRGRCAFCRAPISIRYFTVELLTGLAFLACWLAVGRSSPAVALVYCLIMAGLIAATFIDLEHLIIPDEITLGGMGVGLLCSFAVPALHDTTSHWTALERSALGLGVGAGVVYAVVRLGKLAFGRHKIDLAPGTRVVFTDEALVLPDETIPYEDLFYRKSDAIELEARQLELIDRCYASVRVKLQPEKLWITDATFDPEDIPHMEAVADRLVLPREAMGVGDVKLMGALGAFLGWPATLFALMLSSLLGAVVGLILIALGRHDWSGRLPFGPYIALAAVVWMLGGKEFVHWWFRGVGL